MSIAERCVLQPCVDAVSPPTPQDLSRVPVWENYLIAQAVQASIGQIPEHALAVGIEVGATKVRLHFQLSEMSTGDETDIEDIASELDGLLEGSLEIETLPQVVSQRKISPYDGVRWIFLSRT